MLMVIAPVRTPNAAARAVSEATFALWMTFLLGKQATFGQEPPTSFRSMSAVRWPSFDSVHARYLPASPLPTTTTSYCSDEEISFSCSHRAQSIGWADPGRCPC